MFDAVPFRTPEIPIDQMVIGHRVEEVATLLPRIFNLCRAAQEQAVRLAFGLTQNTKAVAAEIQRDHLMRFFLIWPRHFETALPKLEVGLPTGPAACATFAFGPTGRMPQTRADFDAFLTSKVGIAPILSAIADLFPADTAIAETVPLTPGDQALDRSIAAENSVAGRHADHPVMQSLQASHGRGPLWRATGRAYDLDAAIQDRLPDAVCPEPGQAFVPAARGLYGVKAAQQDGRVTDFTRVTPTDHLIAPGGILDQTLSTLRPSQMEWLPLLIDILDPCVPIDPRKLANA